MLRPPVPTATSPTSWSTVDLTSANRHLDHTCPVGGSEGIVETFRLINIS